MYCMPLQKRRTLSLRGYNCGKGWGMTHACGLLHARRHLFWSRWYLFTTVVEECALMGFRIPGPEVWQP